MTSTTGQAVVTVSRRIGAPPWEIFRILADPGRHPEIDGSGMLRGVVSDGPLSATGDVFVMRMHNERHGDYEMRNHLVEYEPDRRIGWEPRPGRGHPDAAVPGSEWGHRWVFDLLPDGSGSTVVTETFDGSRMAEDKRAEVDGGYTWWQEQMAGTLDRLAALCRPVNVEIGVLKAALDGQRRHVTGILAELSEQDLRRPVLPSGWNCLELLRHLTEDVERFWFAGVIAGEPDVAGRLTAGAETHWYVPEGMGVDEVFAGYRAAITHADAVLAGSVPEQEPASWPTELWPDWRLPDVRHILLHVITEVACHSGHLDAVRELIDGTTWLGDSPYGD